MQIDIERIFKKFLKSKEIYEGKSAIKIVKERLEAYDTLREILNNIDEMSKEDFENILDFNVNKSWSRLYRHKSKIFSDIPRLMKSLKLFLNKSLDIEERFDQVVKYQGKSHIIGIGVGVASAILHIYDPNQYGVWNTRSIIALDRLKMLPIRIIGIGAYYVALNNKLHEMKEILKTDLTTLDLFLGYIFDKPKEYFEEYKIFENLEEFEGDLDIQITSIKSFDKEILLKKIKKKKPLKEFQYTIKQYSRNLYVIKLALQRANGTCECCNESAPFLRMEGSPYLEIHHLIPLSEEGNDDIDNVSAICPNCHKELHFGENKEKKSDDLLKIISKKNSALNYK